MATRSTRSLPVWRISLPMNLFSLFLLCTEDKKWVKQLNRRFCFLLRPRLNQNVRRYGIVYHRIRHQNGSFSAQYDGKRHRIRSNSRAVNATFCLMLRTSYSPTLLHSFHLYVCCDILCPLSPFLSLPSVTLSLFWISFHLTLTLYGRPMYYLSRIIAIYRLNIFPLSLSSGQEKRNTQFTFIGIRHHSWMPSEAKDLQGPWRLY